MNVPPGRREGAPPIASTRRKPQVSARMENMAGDSAPQFWGIMPRDLGNVRESALEHPR